MDILIGWNDIKNGLPEAGSLFLVYGEKLGSCWVDRVYKGVMFDNRGIGIRPAGERHYNKSSLVTHWKYVKQGFNEFNFETFPEEIYFKLYQQLAARTAIYPNRLSNLDYPTHGLTSEAGEVAGKVKKIARDFNGVLTSEMRDAIIKELGDCLWYVAAICDEIAVDMGDVAMRNIKKLSGRAEEGTLTGDGDDR